MSMQNEKENFWQEHKKQFVGLGGLLVIVGVIIGVFFLLKEKVDDSGINNMEVGETSNCVDSSGKDIFSDLDAIYDEVKKQKSCDDAVRIAQSCAWGSSADTYTAGEAYVVCEQELNAFNPSSSVITELESAKSLCREEYEGKAGTMYLAMWSHCDLNAIQKVITQMPEGEYFVRSRTHSDLNGDGIEDEITVLAHIFEREEESSDTWDKIDDPKYQRKVIIILKKDNGQKVFTNVGAILCKWCGGSYGDPFDEISIGNDHSITISNYGGSRYRWYDHVTFSYDPKRDNFFLVSASTGSYDSAGVETVDESGELIYEIVPEDVEITDPKIIGLPFEKFKNSMLHESEN